MMTGSPHLFLVLLTAHLAADFLVQTDRDVLRKSRPGVFLKHVGVVTVLTYVLLGVWSLWLIPVLVAGSHAVIDLLKQWWGNDRPRAFWLDQGAHLIILAVLAATVRYPEGFDVLWVGAFGSIWWKVLVLTSGILVTVFLGGVVIGLWARPFLREVKNEGGDVRTRGLEKGGSMIGRLERALILFLVLIGEPGGVAFLIAAKSVFRFGELSDRQNRMEAEYITIGTLMSFTWGFVAAWVARECLGVF